MLHNFSLVKYAFLSFLTLFLIAGASPKGKNDIEKTDTPLSEEDKIKESSKEKESLFNAILFEETERFPLFDYTVQAILFSPYWHISKRAINLPRDKNGDCCALTTIFDSLSSTRIGYAYSQSGEEKGIETLAYIKSLDISSGDFLVNNKEREREFEILLNEQNEEGEGEEIPKLVAPSDPTLTQKETLLLRNTGDVSLFKFEDEILSLKNKDDKRIIVSGEGELLKRSFYNERFLLTKKETWSIKDLYESKLLKTQTYDYNENEKLSRSTISEDEKKTFLDYDSLGRAINLREFKRIELENEKEKDDEKKSPVIKFILDKRVRYKYNNEGKVAEKELTQYLYEGGDPLAITKKHIKKELFTYKVEKGNPDYLYFEDGVLRIKRLYTDKTTYVETKFFDGGYMVESIYDKGDHKKDNYYMGGALWKSKDFIQPKKDEPSDQKKDEKENTEPQPPKKTITNDESQKDTTQDALTKEPPSQEREGGPL